MLAPLGACLPRLPALPLAARRTSTLLSRYCMSAPCPPPKLTPMPACVPPTLSAPYINALPRVTPATAYCLPAGWRWTSCKRESTTLRVGGVGWGAGGYGHGGIRWGWVAGLGVACAAYQHRWLSTSQRPHLLPRPCLSAGCDPPTLPAPTHPQPCHSQTPPAYPCSLPPSPCCSRPAQAGGHDWRCPGEEQQVRGYTQGRAHALAAGGRAPAVTASSQRRRAARSHPEHTCEVQLVKNSHEHAWLAPLGLPLPLH